MKIDESQKKSLLEMMKSFLNPEGESLQQVTLEQYNQELDEAMERISRGEFTKLDALEKEMQLW